MWQAYFAQLADEFGKLLDQLSKTTSLIFWLLVLLVVLVILLEAFATIAKKKRKESGVSPEVNSILSPSSNYKETREYVSDTQLLSAEPDALLREGGYIIPVERKPLANKIRDRFVVELLISMRLIEEFEGKRPPYGYLILGKNARSVKIYNTPKKQEWLSGYLTELRSILEHQKEPEATPDPRKCSKCLVEANCKYKMVSDSRQLVKKLTTG